MDPQTVVSSASLAPYLDYLLKVHGSDLFLTLGVPPSVKVAGIVHPMQLPPLQSGDAKNLAYSVMSAAQISEFEATQECDLAANIAPYGRFRINVYLQRGEVALVARHISASIPSLEALKLPPILGRLAMEKRGLVLAIGAAGSGKSTTLAAMLDFRNAHARGHILTIEDPIEYLHQHRLSIVEQREVGIDTRSFSDALRHAMREAPDLIMIGEIRDQETMQHAMAYAETGHLCVSTLHANNTNQAIDRILNLYPESARKQVLLDLSLNLRAIIGQRLIPGLKSRLVPAVEVLLQTPYIADLIQKGQIDQIRTAMSKSDEPGIQTFDQSLYTLYSTGEITAEQALENADSKTDLALRIRLQQGSILDGATLGAIDQDTTPRR